MACDFPYLRLPISIDTVAGLGRAQKCVVDHWRALIEPLLPAEKPKPKGVAAT